MTSDAQLDRSYEDACARQWEEENENKDWDKKLDAVGHITKAEEYFDNGIDILSLAVGALAGTETAEDRMIEMRNEFEDLLSDLRHLKKKFIKGE